MSAERDNLIEIKSCDDDLASDILWFLNEWCEQTGRGNPRVTYRADGSWAVTAEPPG